MILTPEQGLAYFTSRLGEPRRAGRSWMFRCIFHGDRNPSLAVPVENSQVFCCHGCGVKGNVLKFEIEFQKLSGVVCDYAGAELAICAELGIEVQSRARGADGEQSTREALYRYAGLDGKIVYAVERRRLAGGDKTFRIMRPDGEGGWVYGQGDVKRTLYRLPEVVVANQVFITEGESCAEAVMGTGIQALQGAAVAVTTSGGSKTWAPELARFMGGKQVIVFGDNDEPGRQYAESAARDCAAFAQWVKVIYFPECGPGGDVADFLKDHDFDALMARVRSAPKWSAEREAAREVVVPAARFLAAAPEEIEWLIEGVIQRRASGIIGALPGLGKSWCAIDIALALALGQPWMGFRVPRPVNVALISREDPPQLTAWRMRQLLAGRDANREELGDSFYVNSQHQTDQFLLDNPDQVAEMMAALRPRKPELVILDVFNVLHSSDENDQQQMRRVLSMASEMQRELSCSIALLHHFRKPSAGSSPGALVEQLRGSSAIGGWRQWIIGLRWEDERQHLRRMQFELKAAHPPDETTFRVETRGDKSWLERADGYVATRAARDAAELLGGKGASSSDWGLR